MPRAACHCTAIRFELQHWPAWILDCNCTLCRRYGAIWVYPEDGSATIVQGEDQTQVYVWGDRMIGFHRCAECGCVTHMATLEDESPRIYGVNARMIPALDPKRVKLRQIDNGHTGFFFTQSDRPPHPGHHPRMPAPSPDDWR